MDSLSSGDPNTAGLLLAASALPTAELLLLEALPPPLGMEFQIRAPGQQMAIVCKTELNARTRA